LKTDFIMKTRFLPIAGLALSICLQGFGQVGINIDGSPPANSAILDVKSDSKGILIPRMTFEERNNIPDPVEGLMIYCTDCNADGTGALSIFQADKWVNYRQECPAPDTPTAGIHIPEYTQIEWHWESVPIAVGYKMNSANEFSSATDMGSATSFLETGLSCGGTITRYVWAYNDCGASAPLMLSQVLNCWACGDPITVHHVVSGGVAPVNKTVTYGTVTNVPGAPSKCWITKNLGADYQADSADDSSIPAAGWFWQFNQRQGYFHNGTSLTPSWTLTYIGESSDWSANNDPCSLELGSGWRVPTYAEWNAVDGTGAWNSVDDAWASLLKLHAGGYLHYADGSLQVIGTGGYFWTSSQANWVDAHYLDLYEGSYMTYGNKAHGFTLRCIKD